MATTQTMRIHNMINRHVFFPTMVALAALTACGEQPPNAATETPLPFELVTDIRQTMEWILEPAVDVIWDSAGTIITSQ